MSIIKVINRKTAIVISVCVLVSSCGHRIPPAPEVHDVNPAISATLARLQGSWISYDYIQSLRVTHSPYRSAEFIDAVFSLIADSNKVCHDTLYCAALVKGLEETIWIALDKKDSTGCYRIGQKKPVDYEADARSSPGDNIVRIRIDSPLVTIYTAASDSMRFTYYDHVYRGRPADYMLKSYTTKTLFDGAYTTTDSDRIFMSSRIVFDPEHMGRLMGSPVYDSFDINIDLLSQRDTCDYMEFFDTKGAAESHSYVYLIKGHKMQIYPLGESLPCRLVADTVAF